MSSSDAGRSRRIEGGQHDVHARLREIVERHRREPFRRPLAAHTREVFEAIRGQVTAARSLILDSGCGTGASTVGIAERWPEAMVLGVDRSAHRLARQPGDVRNAILVRADLVDFWRLAAEAGWRFERQYLLYPNPYPKAAHVGRRWHAHPVFPAILACGGELVLRTNWAIYAREFELALAIWGLAPTRQVVPPVGEPFMTPFETKYARSGHELWEVRAAVSEPVAAEARAAVRVAG